MATKKEIDEAFENHCRKFTNILDGKEVQPEIEELSAKVVEYICTHTHVTFPEIAGTVFKDAGFDYKGNHTLCWDENGMVEIWGGWSDMALDVLYYSFKSGKIGWIPSTCFIGGLPFTYLTTGAVWCLPIVTSRAAKRAIDGTLKSKHWMPVEFVSKEVWVQFVKEHKGAFGLE